MIDMPKYGLNQCRCPVRMRCRLIPAFVNAFLRRTATYARDYIPRFFALMNHEICTRFNARDP